MTRASALRRTSLSGAPLEAFEKFCMPRNTAVFEIIVRPGLKSVDAALFAGTSIASANQPQPV
jgi:hypothetical protein